MCQSPTVFPLTAPSLTLLQDWAAFAHVVTRLSSLKKCPFLVNSALLTSLYVQFMLSFLSEVHLYANVHYSLHNNPSHSINSSKCYLQQQFFVHQVDMFIGSNSRRVRVYSLSRQYRWWRKVPVSNWQHPGWVTKDTANLRMLFNKNDKQICNNCNYVWVIKEFCF